MSDYRVDLGLRLLDAGRSWTDVAEAMGTSVPQAKNALRETLVERRRKTAVAFGAHVPPDPKCAECGCPKSNHTRKTKDGDDGCLTHSADAWAEDEDRPWIGDCTYFYATPDMHEHYVRTALSGGMSRNTLGAMYQLGIDLFPNRYTRWGREGQPVQVAKLATRFRRAQKKLRKQEARRVS